MEYKAINNPVNNHLSEIRDLVQTQAFAGGKQKSLFMKYNSYTTEKLRKYAIKRKIKITKKKNGITVYVKKSTLINKIIDFIRSK